MWGLGRRDEPHEMERRKMNPLTVYPERDARIRIRAYHMWENDGRPEGRAAEFWERAATLERIEENGNPDPLPNPQAAGSAQQPEGAVPGPVTDQGDARPKPKTPRPRKTKSKV